MWCHNAARSQQTNKYRTMNIKKEWSWTMCRKRLDSLGISCDHISSTLHKKYDKGSKPLRNHMKFYTKVIILSYVKDGT